jgi:DNA-binding GntR family transcriptional regulator
MEPERIARSNADDAYQAIRRMIVTVEMPPGRAFTENELVRRLEFGKTPIREALLRLKLEKFVAVQARSGYRVAPVTLKDVRDTCRLLGLLEAQAVEQATADPMAMARLGPLGTQLERAASTDESGDGWIRADWMFHLELARGQDNQLQAEIMTRLNQLMLRFRYLALALGVPGRLLTHGHDAVLASVRSADAAGARVATADDWRETETGLVSVLTATDSMQSTNVWGERDRNSFYLDAVPPGPAIPDVFEPKLPTTPKTNANANTNADA